MRPRYRFCDWGDLEDARLPVFKIAATSFPSSEWASLVRRQPLQQSRDDQAVQWALTTNRVLELHWHESWDVQWNSGWDRDVLERMQAIAFAHGTKHPTLLVFRTPVGESVPLRSESFEDDLSRFQEASRQSSRHRATRVDHQRFHNRDEPGSNVSALGAADQFAELETRVQRLED